MSTAHFIPAPGQGDAQIVVLAVELFAEVVVIVLATTIWEEMVAAEFFAPEEPGLTIEDDVGTEYRRALQVSSATVRDKRAWSNSHGVHRLNLEFEPPTPPDATYLRITLGRWGSVALMI